MRKFEVTIRPRISDCPQYERLHQCMTTLGFLPLGKRNGKMIRYSYLGGCSAEELLNQIVTAVSSIQKRFAVFVYDIEKGRSVGSIN